MKIYETLDLTRSDVVVGRHSIWLPTEQIKVPFQWGGRVQKYQCPQEASYPLDLLWEEVQTLRTLAGTRRGGLGMAPPIGGWVYFKTVISEHPGAWWADPCGAYGYEMMDATKLQPGRFDYDTFRALGVVEGSPGAWNDLNKPGNVINGYLTDLHRSGWDRLRSTSTDMRAPVLYQEDSIKLREDLVREGQFPYRERTEPYQEYFLGKWWPGEREVRRRAVILGYQPRTDERVLDLGCQVGGFLQLAYTRSDQPRLVGVDSESVYVDLARRLARAQGWNICYRQSSVEDASLYEWLERLWGPGGVDHLLLLSMMKHLSVGETTLWRIVDALKPRWAYLETNAVNPQNPWPLRVEVEARGGRYQGNTLDRNERRCYKVPCQKT